MAIQRLRLEYIRDFPIQGIPPEACFQKLGTDERDPTGLRAHIPWSISWDTSDISSLSPTPPPLPCPSAPNIVIPAWTPGATVNPSLSDFCINNDGVSHWSSSDTALMGFAMAGVPAIVVTMVATCCGCIFYYRARERREKAERSIALQLARRDGDGMLPTVGSEQPKET